MVAADEMDSMRVAKLEADEKGDRFNREEASVNIITWRIVSWLHSICVTDFHKWRLCIGSCMEYSPRNR